MPTTPACVGDCAVHGRLCERDAGHRGGHECHDCPGQQARTRARMIADRVAADRLAELVETTPDAD